MDLRKIKKLIELVQQSGLSELEVKSGDETVRIVHAAAPRTPALHSAMHPNAANESSHKDPAAPQAVRQRAATGADFVVEAPLTGTFYRAPGPGEKPFVNSGQQVNVGDVLCIIESMKMMNHIEAERAGKVTAVLMEDGQPVEMGRALFTIG